MVDPRTAYQLDARLLLGLLPRLDQTDLRTVRLEFARYLSTQAGRRTATSWHEAWNAWTGASPQRPGSIALTLTRCQDCRGRGWGTRNASRNLARTGSPVVCGSCRGSRRGSRTQQVALAATAPPPQAPQPRGLG